MHRVELIIIDTMELRRDAMGVQVPNESDRTGVQRRSAHILSPSRPRLPLGKLPSILETRLEDVHGTPPRVSIDESAVRGLAAGPYLSRGQMGNHVGCRIMEVSRMAKRKRPEIALMVFGPPKSCMDHHRASSPDSGLDAIFGNTVLMVTANPAVLDTLSFDEELGAELFRGVDPIIGAVLSNKNANRCSLTFELKLGLNSFRPSKPNLVDDRDLATGSVAEERATTILLRREGMATGSKLATLETGLVLV
jgi:hypothetical protein